MLSLGFLKAEMSASTNAFIAASDFFDTFEIIFQGFGFKECPLRCFESILKFGMKAYQDIK